MAAAASRLDLFKPRLNKYIKDKPYPKQGAALIALQAFSEVCFGGAAMGGKSHAMLMAALQYVDVPGYSAIIFRRTYPQLTASGGMIPRSMEWLSGTDAVWREQTKTWTFPGGATLKFSHMQSEKDKYDHQGPAYQFAGFEELTQFTETQYAFIQSRIRRTKDSKIPLRTFSTCNPGGVGHRWVKDRFIVGRAPDRLFIPSKLEDNRSANADEYDRQLRKLGEVDYQRYRHGNWDIEEGDQFSREDFQIKSKAPEGIEWVRFWDLATTESRRADFTAGALVGFDAHGNLWIANITKGQWSWPKAEQAIFTAASMDGRNVPVGVETISGFKIAGAELSRAPELYGHTLKFVKHLDGDKVARASPWVSLARRRKLYLVAGHWNGDFIDECISFPGGRWDDQIDAVSGAVQLIADGVANNPGAWLDGI